MRSDKQLNLLIIILIGVNSDIPFAAVFSDFCVSPRKEWARIRSILAIKSSCGLLIRAAASVVPVIALESAKYLFPSPLFRIALYHVLISESLCLPRASSVLVQCETSVNAFQSFHEKINQFKGTPQRRKQKSLRFWGLSKIIRLMNGNTIEPLHVIIIFRIDWRSGKCTFLRPQRIRLRVLVRMMLFTHRMQVSDSCIQNECRNELCQHRIYYRRIADSNHKRRPSTESTCRSCCSCSTSGIIPEKRRERCERS